MRVLRIHSPSAHVLGTCWCRSTKRQIYSTAEPEHVELAAYFANYMRAQIDDILYEDMGHQQQRGENYD
jgi:hypothetical protein